MCRRINEKYISWKNQKRSNICWIKGCRLYSFSCLDNLNLGLFSSFFSHLSPSLWVLCGLLRAHKREKLLFSSCFSCLSCSSFSSYILLFGFFFSYAFLLPPLFHFDFILRVELVFIYYSWLCFFLQPSLYVSLTSCNPSRIPILFFAMIEPFNFRENIYILFYDTVKR